MIALAALMAAAPLGHRSVWGLSVLRYAGMAPPPYEVYYDDFDPAFAAPPPTYVWMQGMVVEQELAKREEGLEMRGTLPALSAEYGYLRHTLNEQIARAVNARIRAAKEMKARAITFSYDVHATDALISIILLSTVTSAASKTEVSSVNFRPDTGEPVSLSAAAGPDIAALAGKILTEKVRRNPEKYNPAFDIYALPEQPFYLTDEAVVLLFDEFQLSSAADGVTQLELPLSRIRTFTLPRGDYRVNAGYDIKMIPLERVCSALGYEVAWNYEAARAEVYRGGQFILDVKPGVNNYLEPNRRVRSLETAPEIIMNRIFVPISFFDRILSLVTYRVDERENITFTAYLDN